MRDNNLFRAAQMLAALLVAIPVSIGAAPTRTVTLSVENMTCAMCPITVRKALEKVPGVESAEAKYVGDGYEGRGTGWAKVTFDPDRTDIAALTRATRQAGYPSHVRQEKSHE